MSANYPFLDRVRATLNNQKDAKKRSLRWLAAQIDKSERWFYNITEFEKLSIADIEKISSLLDENFMADYNKWRVENDQASLNILGEPPAQWKVEPKRVHIQLKLSAAPQNAENNMSKMLMIIRREGEKLGFEME
jgi:hypothetical protein